MEQVRLGAVRNRPARVIVHSIGPMRSPPERRLLAVPSVGVPRCRIGQRPDSTVPPQGRIPNARTAYDGSCRRASSPCPASTWPRGSEGVDSGVRAGSNRRRGRTHRHRAGERSPRWTGGICASRLPYTLGRSSRSRRCRRSVRCAVRGNCCHLRRPAGTSARVAGQRGRDPARQGPSKGARLEALGHCEVGTQRVLGRAGTSA